MDVSYKCDWSETELQLSSVQVSRSVVFDFVTHGLHHTRLPCPSLSPWVCSNSCLLSQQSYLTSSFSVASFSFCLQSFPASGSFPMSWFFCIRWSKTGASASASVLLMNIQEWFPLELTGLISLLSKGLSRVFSSFSIISISPGALRDRVRDLEILIGKVCCRS